MKEEHRRSWLLPVIVASVLLLGTAYWGYTQYQQKQQLLTYLNNRNQKAFFEMVDQVENMEVLLAKTVASGSPNHRRILFSDIWLQASAAQGNLGSLPISQFQIGRTEKFFSQVGDYAYTLSKKLSADNKLSNKEEDRLEGLHTEAGFLLAELQKIRSRAADGRLSWGEVEMEAPRLRKASANGFVDGITKLDKQMERYPTLIYDGPFSDHIELEAPKGLTGSKVSPTEAKNIAARLLDGGNKPLFRAQRVQTVQGRIPAYRVHFQPQAGTGPTATVDISRKGGHVVMMLVNRSSGNRDLTLKQAEEKASRYLEAQGLENMVSTNSMVQADNAVIAFAYQEKGVIVYPDLIKVKVAMDNGDIIGLEALGYLMSHRNRDIPEPEISLEEARKKVNSRLKIQQSRLVIIPTETLGEKLAYEFKGDLNGDPFIVYINAMNGREERVLKVIETKDGPLTM